MRQHTRMYVQNHVHANKSRHMYIRDICQLPNPGKVTKRVENK